MPFPVEEKYIVEVERELGLKFPDSIRRSFMKMNGGEYDNGQVNWYFHPFLDKSDRKRISRTSNHILLETKEARNWRNFPQDSVSIGRDDYGNQIILRPKFLQKKRLQGSIYFWDHETGKTRKVAKNINELKK